MEGEREGGREGERERERESNGEGEEREREGGGRGRRDTLVSNASIGGISILSHQQSLFATLVSLK